MLLGALVLILAVRVLLAAATLKALCLTAAVLVAVTRTTVLDATVRRLRLLATRSIRKASELSAALGRRVARGAAAEAGIALACR